MGVGWHHIFHAANRGNALHAFVESGDACRACGMQQHSFLACRYIQSWQYILLKPLRDVEDSDLIIVLAVLLREHFLFAESDKGMGAGSGVAHHRNPSLAAQTPECLHGLVGGEFLTFGVALVLPYLRAAEAMHLLGHRHLIAGAVAKPDNHFYQVILAKGGAAENPRDAGREIDIIRAFRFAPVEFCGEWEIF